MVGTGESRFGARTDGAAPDDGAASGDRGARDDGAPRGDVAILAEELGRFVEHVANLVRIRAARRRLQLQRLIVLGVAGAVVTLLLVVVGLRAVDLLARGVGGGFAAAFSERPWLGELAGGLALLALAALPLWLLWAAGGASITRRLRRRLAAGDGREKADLAPFGAEEAREFAELRASLKKAGADLQIVERLREFVRRDPELALACAAALGAVLAPYALRAAKTSMPTLIRWAQRAASLGQL